MFHFSVLVWDGPRFTAGAFFGTPFAIHQVHTKGFYGLAAGVQMSAPAVIFLPCEKKVEKYFHLLLHKTKIRFIFVRSTKLIHKQKSKRHDNERNFQQPF